MLKKFLFISHETSRTGAPLVLFYLISWLKENKPELQLDLCCLKKGELLTEFQNICNKVYIIPDIKKSSKENGLFKRKLTDEEINNSVTKKIASNNYDKIYCNTVLSIPLGSKIKACSPAGLSLIAHIHELDTIVSLVLPRFQSYKDSVDHFIAVSRKVENMLKEKFGINEDKVSLCYGFTKVPEFRKNHNKVDKQDFIVGGSGTVHWRKGSDLFILVAKAFFLRYPEAKVKFIWVGEIGHEDKVIYNADIEKAGLSSKVNFTGAKKDPFDYYQDFDVMLLTSREDPFPLVAIELGILGKPIICFEGATGTEEVLSEREQAIAPYLDLNIMAEKIYEFYKDPRFLSSEGKIITSLFSNFTPENQCPQIFKILNN